MFQSRATEPGSRIVAIDAVRGFALLGIVAVHFVEQYLGSPPPASQTSAPASILDSVIVGIDAILFVGKFFALFSLLFGLSFFIQMDRAAARGHRFAGRFTWRLAVLFVIGMAHHLVYRGDILAVYAALGLVLLAYYRASDRWLIGSAVAILLGAPRLLGAVWVLATGSTLSFSAPPDTELQAYWDTLRSGTPIAIAWLNLTSGIWPKLDFLFGWFGRGWQTLGLFLLGLYIGRHRWHLHLESRRQSIKRLTWWSLGTSLGVLVLIAGIYGAAVAAGVAPPPGAQNGPPQVPPLWFLVIGLTLYDVFNLGIAGAMLGGFLLLYSRPRAQGVLRWFAPIGQTALTTYVAQSVIGAFIFYGYGLGLLGEAGAAARFALALAVFGGQTAISALWLRLFRHGPLEWLWRSATFLELQPLFRRRPVAQSPQPAPTLRA